MSQGTDKIRKVKKMKREPQDVRHEKGESVQLEPQPPKPDPSLIDRPRMGKYANVAEGGEDILIRIMDWFAGEKNDTNREGK